MHLNTLQFGAGLHAYMWRIFHCFSNSESRLDQMGAAKVFSLLGFLSVAMAVLLVFESAGAGGDLGMVPSEEEEEEDMELERQLKVLNKPGRKSFQDLDGSIYDCVDIDKQPALDHPLLKNHKVQMEQPSVLPKEVINRINQASSSLGEPVEIGIKGAECPPGTVIIRRTRKEDLIWAREQSKAYHSKTVKSNGYHVAGVGTANGRYYGASGMMDVFNPYVKRNQFSEAIIRVQHRSPETSSLNYVQAGWAVNPMLFKDNQSRLSSYWTADEYRKTGCFNTLCPGFVHVSRNITFGVVLPASKYGHLLQSAIIIQISQHPETGDWWLKTNPGDYQVGYWPKALFTGLADHATEIYWGGEVHGPVNDSPPMGSGHFAEEKYGRACFVGNMQISKKANVFVDAHTVELTASTTSDCYTSFASGDRFKMIFFGGPGGVGC